MSAPRLFKSRLIILAIILAIGVFLRLPPELFQPNTGPLHALESLHPRPDDQKGGYDERLYEAYAKAIGANGLTSYPDIVRAYIEKQKTLPSSILPPLRFFYIFLAYLYHALFSTPERTALHYLSSIFSMLTLLLSAIFASRLGRSGYTLGVTALMAVAPTQLHMSQHGLIDGFFTFWAMLALWIAFIGVIVANRWLAFGVVTREMIIATVLGSLLGVVILLILAGGVGSLIETYTLSVSKNYTLDYAIQTGDGPWYRYLVDLLLVSPVVLLLAIGAVFTIRREQKVEWFFALFIAISYLIMCNIKYGMNLRYANMWDLPLRVLAFSQVLSLSRLFPRAQNWLIIGATSVLCLIEFHQYIVLAVNFPLYELATQYLMYALKILKFSPQLHP
ncbi:MAG: hypothetical protein DME40_19870 [Verrucomicrobia bacterium]|nr:MAG: hypothetical protein DME40_19870 [Verrucomicrobiota bacterium]